MNLPVGVLTQRSGYAPVQIKLFLCAKFLLKVQLNSAFFFFFFPILGNHLRIASVYGQSLVMDEFVSLLTKILM